MSKFQSNTQALVLALQSQLSSNVSGQAVQDSVVNHLKALKQTLLDNVEKHFNQIISQVQAQNNLQQLEIDYQARLKAKLEEFETVSKSLSQDPVNERLFNSNEYINLDPYQLVRQLQFDAANINTNVVRFDGLQKELNQLINYNLYRCQINREYRVFNNIVETIGNTPLVRLNQVTKEMGVGAEVLLKLEFFNPLSSVKDRIGSKMITDLLNTGKINKDTILIEPTSGNTGIGLAFVASALNLKLVLVMPETMSLERRKLFKILGAKLVLSEGPKGMNGAIAKAKELQEKIKNSYVVGQFENYSNPQIHRLTTAQEIWRDTDGQVDIVVAGVGTGGTITGIGEILKQKNPNIKIIAVEPEASPVLSGGKPGPHKIQGIGAGFVPKVLNTQVYDEIYQINQELSGSITHKINQEEGIPIGISSGAVALAALEIGKRPENKGKKIVAIMASSCERYLSTWVFDQINIESEEEQVLKQFANQ